MNTKIYKRLGLKERVVIQTLLEEDRSKSSIAKSLNRSRSTISRAINKWIENPKDKYDAALAGLNANDDHPNKRNLDRISTYGLLRFYVHKGTSRRLIPQNRYLEGSKMIAQTIP